MEQTHHHLMYDEIHEEPELIRRLLLDRHNEDLRNIYRIVRETVSDGGDIFLVGSGSSYNSCIFARNLFSIQNHILVNTFQGSEFINYVSSVDRKSLVIFVSQSGESADEIEAYSHIKNTDAMTIAMVNDLDSTLAHLCKEVLPISAGVERAIPATKTYIAEMFQFFLLSEELSGGYTFEDSKGEIISEMNRILSTEYQKQIRAAAKKLINTKTVFVLGSGIDLANASETALKIKECARIEAEAFPIHEFIHGPISMLGPESAVIIFEPGTDSDQETFKKILEVARKAQAVSVLVGGKESYGADLHLPVTDFEVLSVFPEIIPMQLVAYYLAIYRSLNPDKPIGLEKVVK